jgi:signal transduction histidine kinase
MRKRVRQLMEDRTRMLRAVSHDLRTPLTRLKMRVERTEQPVLRDAMLSDIAALSAMIEESLTYLSRSTSLEEASRSIFPASCRPSRRISKTSVSM